MNKLFSLLSTLYIAVFGTPLFEKINNRILALALKARGFNNHKGYAASGEQHFIEKILPKLAPRICVDIGANKGTYTKVLLENTNTTVYAFEPLTQPYQSLKTLGETYGDRLIPVNKGVGSRDETRTIHFSNEQTSHASFSEEVCQISYVKNDLTQDIEIITLDTYFQDAPDGFEIDLLKIDTEGFEHEVLCGAQNLVTQYRPKMIQIEYNWHQLFMNHSILSFAKMLPGYQVFQMLPNRLAKRDPNDPYANIFLFSNFVFVRRDLLSIAE